jgi:hypothetical protein
MWLFAVERAFRFPVPCAAARVRQEATDAKDSEFSVNSGGRAITGGLRPFPGNVDSRRAQLRLQSAALELIRRPEIR